MAISIEFGTFEATEKANEYKEVIQQLADLNDESKSVVITVPVADAQKTQFQVQRAANEINKTARLRLKDESNVRVAGQDDEGNDVHEGNVSLTFTLTKKHNARNRKKGVVSNNPENTTENNEVPADEVTDEATEEVTESRKRR